MFIITKAPRGLYNMPKKKLEPEDDVICSHNESYNIRDDEILHGIEVKFLEFELIVA